MPKIAVLNIVGLTPHLIGDHTPEISSYIHSTLKQKDKFEIPTIKTIVPAVTCSVQSTLLTGKYPNEHGIVGNGWYDRELAEVQFWKQSNHLVQGEKIWDIVKKNNSNATCANICWWYNMYSSVDYSVTPRPMYLADGRKLPDCYTKPAGLRDELQSKLGQFPLFHFWGPATSIKSSEWIANAAKLVYEKHQPNLSFVYLPHLDYALQKFGVDDFDAIGKDLREIDKVVAGLIRFYEENNVKVILLSEYGIVSVDTSIAINRILREHGYIAIREELGKELLDTGESSAFAVSDHQIAHVYLKKNTDEIKTKIKKLLESNPHIAEVWDTKEKKEHSLDHPRSGDLIAIAKPNAWFTYYYWLDDKKAPDYATTVDIHRKPGYDPVEMFMNKKIPFLKLQLLFKILKKKIGFRQLLDVISLDARLVKGSHGILNEKKHSPIFVSPYYDKTEIPATDVQKHLLSALNEGKKVKN